MRWRIGIGLALTLWVPALQVRAKEWKSVLVPLAEPNAPVATLLADLASPEAGVRAEAAWQLTGARERQGEVRARLEPLRVDPERAVRYAATWAVAHLALSQDGSLNPEDVDVPPKPVHIARPQYPEPAFKAKIEGQVELEILIGEDGEVAHVELRKSIPGLDAAALDCVRQWRFEPARRAGTAQPVMANAPVRFRRF